MSLDYAILGFLTEGEQTGYDLKTRCFDRKARHFWTADQAQVYRTLERLENGRFVASRFEPQRGKPGRKVYSITTPGREHLTDWLASTHEPVPSRDPFLLQLYFADALPAETVLSVLSEARETHQRRLDALRTELAAHAQSTTSGRRDEFARLTLEATLAATRATIDWLDDCIDTLRAEEDARTTRSGPQRRLFDSHEQPEGKPS